MEEGVCGGGLDLHEALHQHHGEQGGVQPASICGDISHGLQDTQALVQHALGVGHIVADWRWQPPHVCLQHHCVCCLTGIRGESRKTARSLVTDKAEFALVLLLFHQ